MRMEPLTDRLGVVLFPDGTTKLPKLAKEEARRLLSDHGVVVFEGFDCDLTEFERFTDLLGRIVLGTRPASARPEIPFHQEAAWITPRPPVIWFYCIAPAVIGGETRMVDGVRVLEEMGPALQQLFRSKTIRYHLDWPDQDSTPYPTRAWQYRLGTQDRAVASAKLDKMPGASHSWNDDGTLLYRFDTSALCESRVSGQLGFVNSLLFGVRNEYRVCFSDGSEIPADVVAELTEITDRLTVILDWAPKKFLMLDNTRLMHARGPFCDMRREVRARHASFD